MRKNPSKDEEHVKIKLKDDSFVQRNVLDLMQDEILKANQYFDSLQKQLNAFYEKLGMSPKEIKNYLDNPLNFSESEWKILQEMRESLQSKIWESMGKEQKHKNAKKQMEKASKERKGKTLGSRKNWISMR